MMFENKVIYISGTGTEVCHRWLSTSVPWRNLMFVTAREFMIGTPGGEPKTKDITNSFFRH